MSRRRDVAATLLRHSAATLERYDVSTKLQYFVRAHGSACVCGNTRVYGMAFAGIVVYCIVLRAR